MPNIKGEYETSSAFDARVANAMNKLTLPVIVEIPLDKKHITYNADDKSLNIERYAFANLITSYGGVFGYGTKFYGEVKYGSSDNIDIVWPSTEKKLGSYIGTNAMGVKVRVTKVKRHTMAIFECKGSFGDSLFLQKGSPLMTIQDITPDAAKSLKATVRGAIMYIPKQPYYAKGKYLWDDPTIDSPMDIDETMEVAIGDIQCAMLLDSTGKVLAVAATK